MASWTNNKAHYQELARTYHPGAKLVTKSSWFFKMLAIFAAPFVGYTYWLEHYAMAIGPLQAYPAQWPDLRTGTVVHECRHSWQCELLGWVTGLSLAGIAVWLGLTASWGYYFIAAPIVPMISCWRTYTTWVGLPLFLVLYFLVPFFIGLAIFKCWFELDADRAKWKWALAQGKGPEYVRDRAKKFGATVNGKGYGFAFPIVGPKWFASAAEKVIRKWQTQTA